MAGILIVGGGLVGSSLALALSRSGIAATLVEARAGTSALADPARERYLALARGSINALRALGVWPELDPHAASIRGVHVSRRGEFGRVLLRACEHGIDRFGAVVPASRLGLALEAALQRATGLVRRAPATLEGFVARADGVEATIKTDAASHREPASLLVGADGAQSQVRDLAELPCEHHDYGQDALVHSIGLGRDHEGIAYERFTDDGAIALLPLPGRRAGMVWTMPRERAQVMAALGEDARLAALQTTFGDRLGRFHSPGHLVRYPLSRSFAPRTVDGRVVLIGNAAQSLHPVAAQGFNLGLRDALVLAEEIVRSRDSVELSEAPLPRALLRHANRRDVDRTRIATLSDRLARWPKLSAPGASAVRALAIGVVNAVPALRESLVLAAMGFGEDVPALALEPAA